LKQFCADTVTMTGIAQGQKCVYHKMLDLQFYLEADVKVSYHHHHAVLESVQFAEMQRSM
jgi:hypothetical protein